MTPAGVAQGGLGPALPGQGCLAKSLAGDVLVAVAHRVSAIAKAAAPFFHSHGTASVAAGCWPESPAFVTPAGVAQGGLGLALPGQGCLAKSLAGKVTVAAVEGGPF